MGTFLCQNNFFFYEISVDKGNFFHTSYASEKDIFFQENPSPSLWIKKIPPPLIIKISLAN